VVRLRDVERADLEVFFEQQQDPEAVTRSKVPPRERERFMTHWSAKVLGDPTVNVQTITVDDEPAGHVVAWWVEDRRFVGYWLGRPYWGRGVGTEAVALFLQQEPTRPLYADPFVGNTASVRVLEKCGFRRIETLRHGEHEHVLLMLGED
jgi:RimJ/RimL family protein N-acetyltransferase